MLFVVFSNLYQLIRLSNIDFDFGGSHEAGEMRKV